MVCLLQSYISICNYCAALATQRHFMLSLHKSPRFWVVAFELLGNRHVIHVEAVAHPRTTVIVQTLIASIKACTCAAFVHGSRSSSADGPHRPATPVCELSAVTNCYLPVYRIKMLMHMQQRLQGATRPAQQLSPATLLQQQRRPAGCRASRTLLNRTKHSSNHGMRLVRTLATPEVRQLLDAARCCKCLM